MSSESRDFVRYEVPLRGPSAPLPTHLRRFGDRAAGAPAVVLLHGGNTSGDTFLVPEGGLVGYLVERKLDVWVLEWRSSPHVVGPLLRQNRPLLGATVADECALFTLDHVVDEELTTALEIVRKEIGEEAELSLLGHCFGSAAVSIAVARGLVERFRVANLVLSTLGLFVEVPWNGWVKAEDFIMERVLHNDQRCRGIDPLDLPGWAPDMKTAFDRWPARWLPPAGGPAPVELLRRLSFMFGQPYALDRLHPSLRGSEVDRFFGPMHVGLFMHASQMVRRGFAARFDAPDVIDRPRVVGGGPGRPAGDNDLDPTWFRNKRVTLLAAGQNHLWHRDSVDLMYEWLRSQPGDSSPSRYAKRVFPGYNLQELMWGDRARQEVFPAIEQAIRPAAEAQPQRSRAVAGAAPMAAFGLAGTSRPPLEAPNRPR
jgi:hypothetical protein